MNFYVPICTVVGVGWDLLAARQNLFAIQKIYGWSSCVSGPVTNPTPHAVN